MQLQPHVESIQNELAALAGLGDESTAAAAERLARALGSTLGLRLLDVVSEAALEVSGQLSGGHVEVRIAGQDPSLVYVEAAEEEPRTSAGEELAARITLRLPETLKAAVEAAAAREGVSANTWIVRALGRALSGPPSRRLGNRMRGFAQS
jgi:predicted DNA binding CopG/RHH family protein